MEQISVETKQPDIKFWCNKQKKSVALEVYGNFPDGGVKEGIHRCNGHAHYLHYTTDSVRSNIEVYLENYVLVKSGDCHEINQIINDKEYNLRIDLKKIKEIKESVNPFRFLKNEGKSQYSVITIDNDLTISHVQNVEIIK